MTDDRPGRGLTWIPIAAAATAVAAVVVLTILLGGGSNRGVGETSRVDGDGALICPKQNAAGHVPTKPHGVNPGDRLVPDAAIAHLTVCHYTAEGDLDGRVVVKQGRDVAQVALRAAGTTKDSCTASGQQYLVGAVYDKGYVWIDTVAGSCALATNGAGSVRTSALTVAAARAYIESSWTSP